MKFFFKSIFGKVSPPLRKDEKVLIDNLNLPEELAIAIKQKTKNKIEPLLELQMGDEEDYDDEPKRKGIKSLVNQKQNVPHMLRDVKALQSDNRFFDYHIFSCGHFGSDKDYFIAAIKTNDQYECLSVFETNGINYNIETKDIITFFQKWESKMRFSIIDAYHDRVIIQLKDFNFDIDNFSKEALKFCPDFEDCVEDSEGMKKYIRGRKGEVDFWWD